MMKKRDKLIAGLVIGGAIGSVLGFLYKNKNGQEIPGNPEVKSTTDTQELDSLVKPKRKGMVLRLLDWLDHE